MRYKEEFKKKKRQSALLKFIGKILFACVIAAALVYVLFFAKLFDVRAVEVRSPSTISATDVQHIAVEVLEKRWLGISRQRNIIIFSPQAIRSELLRTIPRIKEVAIKRASLHTLEIAVSEREAIGMWCLVQIERCYYFDESGTAFAELLPTTGYRFIAISDSRDRIIMLGSSVATAAWRDHILGVKKHLQFGGISIAEVQIPPDSYEEFHVVTREGWKILMSNDTNIERQITSMLLLLKKDFTPDTRRALQYMDLRVDDRIYYK